VFQRWGKRTATRVEFGDFKFPLRNTSFEASPCTSLIGMPGGVCVIVCHFGAGIINQRSTNHCAPGKRKHRKGPHPLLLDGSIGVTSLGIGCQSALGFLMFDLFDLLDLFD